MSTFSHQHGLQGPSAPIEIRNEAPQWLRTLVVELAYQLGLEPTDVRKLLCQILLTSPDPNAWTQYPNVDNEVRNLISNADWFHVYDFIELLHSHLARTEQPGSLATSRDKSANFTARLNDAFRRKGVAWQLQGGHIEIRGEASFEAPLRAAIDMTEQTCRPVAKREFHEALCDLSKRPEPDVTGAIQHGMAALECVARDIAGESNATLGAIIKSHPAMLPKPLDEAVAKLWGYASQQARHLREGSIPSLHEAELVVCLAGSVATYLMKQVPKTSPRLKPV